MGNEGRILENLRRINACLAPAEKIGLQVKRVDGDVDFPVRYRLVTTKGAGMKKVRMFDVYYNRKDAADAIAIIAEFVERE